MTVEYEADLAYLSKGFANHTVVGFDNDHQNSLQDHPKRKFDYSVMFGGRNEEGIVKPDLIKAKISRNKVFYQRVATIGKPPAARYNHSMTYLTKQNILCVFGGQGEDVETSMMADCMNIINMDALQWHSCKMKRKPEMMFESRYCHGAVAFKDSIILFGGINSAGFVDSSIEIIKIEENRTEVSEVVEEASVILPDPVSIKKLQKNKSKNTAIEHVPIAFEPIRSLPKIADHGRRNLLPIPLDDESLMPDKNNFGSKKTGSKWAKIMFRTVTHKVVTPQVSPHKGSLKSLNLYD